MVRRSRSTSASSTSSSTSSSSGSSTTSSTSSASSAGSRRRNSPKRADRRSPEKNKSPGPVNRVSVRNISRNVSREHLLEIFGLYGPVKDVRFPTNSRHPCFPRGDAVIEYENHDDAEKALRHMDGGQIDGLIVGCREVRCADHLPEDVLQSEDLVQDHLSEDPQDRSDVLVRPSDVVPQEELLQEGSVAPHQEDLLDVLPPDVPLVDLDLQSEAVHHLLAESPEVTRFQSDATEVNLLKK
ncbi:hypothetical protein FO519_004629 [Halicephalobus sp. NKZ332]|nr:hypothetical protein FO519_004629 [Halicephalobus sp. NKZ332]